MKPIVELVSEWSDFTDKNSDHKLASFCKYYLEKEKIAANESSKPASGRAKNRGSLLKAMGRILSAHSLYMRAAMRTVNLPGLESFYYLNGLNYLGEVRKSDLINYLFAETTTGMEAINKLITAKMINERVSPDDKRAKLIRLTPKGIEHLEKAYLVAGKVAEITLATMDDASIVQCYELLKDCELQQSKLAVELKNQSFDEMYERFK